MNRPDSLFDRRQEWEDLSRFCAGGEVVRYGVVYGRRRQGKSWLLRRLVAAVGGVYVMALQHDRASALARFAEAVSAAAPVPGLRPVFGDWDEAIRVARAVLGQSGQRLLVLDEYPYLLEHSPELSSVLQAHYDDARNQEDAAPLRVLLCGSAIGIMEELLSGSSPLRGRAQLELKIGSFDYRDAARFWGVTDPATAFLLHATVGGTPGYRDLVQDDVPESASSFPAWLERTVLNPSSALFTEADYLLREDPRSLDRGPYYAVLGAVSAGHRTPTAIGGAIGRDRTALSHPLGVLATAGFLTLAADLRRQRGSSIRLADPIVRFHHVVTRPRLAQFEERRFDAAWESALPSFRSLVLGPHFEHLAREWVRRYASPATTGGVIGEVGSTTIADAAERTTREVDVVALAAGERVRSKTSRILCIGEAKSSDRERGPADLARLDRTRALLVADGADCADARLLLFGRSGFSPELQAAARRRRDVELVDLDTIYSGA